LSASEHGFTARRNPYRRVLADVIERGADQHNARTDEPVRSLVGHVIRVPLDCGRVPLPGLRAVKPRIAAAEVAWVLAGDRSTRWLKTKTMIWDAFTETDSTGDAYVEAHYGHRWRRAFHRDQLAQLVTTLRRDPSNRQALMVTWDASCDGLEARPKKMIPCPFAVQGTIAGGGLTLTLSLRSSDILVGLPVDWVAFSLLADAIATSVEVPPHPGWAIDEIVADPDGYVEEVTRHARATKQPTYKVKLRAAP